MVAVLSDIHSNREALEAVIADMGPVDYVICLGDMVGYGPDPVHCLELVRGSGWPCLMGNHDFGCVDTTSWTWFGEVAGEALRWTRSRLSDPHLAWLAGLPRTFKHQDALCVHGSPRSPLYEYIDSPTVALEALRHIGSGLCFHGHTHVSGMHVLQGAKPVFLRGRGMMAIPAGPVLVNPGSVGQPRDGIAGAAYLLWEPEGRLITFKRVAYRVGVTRDKIVAAGLPPMLADRLLVGS